MPIDKGKYNNSRFTILSVHYFWFVVRMRANYDILLKKLSEASERPADPSANDSESSESVSDPSEVHSENSESADELSAAISESSESADDPSAAISETSDGVWVFNF